MKPYILTTVDKHKILISEEERKRVLDFLNNGSKAVVIQDCLISLAIAPEIMPFLRWYDQENDRLKNSGKRICKKCLGVMSCDTGCTCWQGVAADGKNPLGIPDFIRKQLIARPMPDADPFLVEWDEAEYESKRKSLEYVESNGALGYKDPESGETFYQ